MVNLGDLLPHRQLINHALRKASDDLKSEIASYQIQYEQKVVACKKEIAEEIQKKDRHFEELKQAYTDRLTGEGSALEETQEIFFKYVDVYRERQILKFQREKVIQELTLRKEYREFLQKSERLTDADIEILNERKDILSKQSSVEDVVALLQLSNGIIECTSEDNAKSLLDKVNNTLEKAEELNETTRSLARLRTLLYERNEYLSVIQYISWLIQQKENLKSELKNKQAQLQSERNSLFPIKNDLDHQIEEKNEVLIEYSNEIRNIWARPLADLLVRRAQIELELTDSYNRLNQIQAAIRQMMEESSHDSDRWERLQGVKSQTKANIGNLKSQREALKADVSFWKARRKTIIGICKDNKVFLEFPRDDLSDEIRVLLWEREEYFSQIEDLTVACDKDIAEKKESYQEEINELKENVSLIDCAIAYDEERNKRRKKMTEDEG